MNKSTIRTVGIALFLMLAVTFPVSAGVTVYEINSDDSRTVINSSNSHTISVVQGTDGEITISEDNSVPELLNNVHADTANYKSVTITPDSKDPVHIVDENGSIDTYHVDVVEPSATIDAFAATTWHYASATNYRTGWSCSASSSNYDGGASAQSSGTTVSSSYW